jgi:hypothetical protein
MLKPRPALVCLNFLKNILLGVQVFFEPITLAPQGVQKYRSQYDHIAPMYPYLTEKSVVRVRGNIMVMKGGNAHHHQKHIDRARAGNECQCDTSLFSGGSRGIQSDAGKLPYQCCFYQAI